MRQPRDPMEGGASVPRGRVGVALDLGPGTKAAHSTSPRQQRMALAKLGTSRSTKAKVQTDDELVRDKAGADNRQHVRARAEPRAAPALDSALPPGVCQLKHYRAEWTKDDAEAERSAQEVLR